MEVYTLFLVFDSTCRSGPVQIVRSPVQVSKVAAEGRFELWIRDGVMLANEVSKLYQSVNLFL